MEPNESKLHRHFKLFKPYGYLSQFESNARHQRNSKFLKDLHKFPEGIMAIGRLDKDSEGLLLLTTDGRASHEITSGNVEKEYYVQVDGRITDAAIHTIKKGLEISIEGETYTTNPCTVKKLLEEPQLPERAKHIRHSRHGDTSWISVILTEGKFRQVRKMTAAVGFHTLRLIRIRVGKHHLDGMQPLEVVELDNLL